MDRKDGSRRQTRGARRVSVESATEKLAATPGVTIETNAPVVRAQVGVADRADDPFGWCYAVDFWQRSILFLDVLRERANNMLAHEEAGMPPVLAFQYEMLVDGRTLERPANYALLRIRQIGDKCFEDCVNPDNPPVMVIDPRAGHGPGIGGFKRESEVGIAFHEGYPVYFVSFFPAPCPGQTLADVLYVLRRFVNEVSVRHSGKRPILYGNCQGGWMAALLSADCDVALGPTVLNGSPLSYWAGEDGANPMRLAGGLLGGAWLARFASDLGNGTFDGAWLVANFESLKPEITLWEKYAHLFHNIDEERDRFLAFERWWSGFYKLSREEITTIVEALFVGNRLEQGQLNLGDGCAVDLTRIRNPIVVFASSGDNITPPHQALAWLAAVYRSTDALKEAGQRVVYLINPHVGHLGLFVSAAVARFEHRAILENLGEIEKLAPGLYQMETINPTGDPDCRRPQYTVSFVERRVEDLGFDYPRDSFERVRAVSELNDALYRMVASPWVRACASPWSATASTWLHPMRTGRYLMSERFLPWTQVIAACAETIRRSRVRVERDHPLRTAERTAIEQMTKAIMTAREMRDRVYEDVFRRCYGLSLPWAPPAPANTTTIESPTQRAER